MIATALSEITVDQIISGANAYSGKRREESSNSSGRVLSLSLSPSLLPPSRTISELAVDVADVTAVFEVLSLSKKGFYQLIYQEITKLTLQCLINSKISTQDFITIIILLQQIK